MFPVDELSRSGRNGQLRRSELRRSFAQVLPRGVVAQVISRATVAQVPIAQAKRERRKSVAQARSRGVAQVRSRGAIAQAKLGVVG